MTQPLETLEAVLTPVVQEAGFTLTDRADWADLAWLHYCAATTTGPRLLEITHQPTRRRIVAELWRPTRLAEAIRAGVLEGAADHRLSWRYAPAANPEACAREVAAAVAAWLSTSGGERRSA